MKLISTNISAPPVLQKNDDPNSPVLIRGFADLPLSLATYAGINLTAVPANSFGSYKEVTQTFDGIIGSLQSNQSDYTLTPSTIDYSGIYGKGHGVILTKFLSQNGHTIASSPNGKPNGRQLETQEFLFLDRISFQSMVVTFAIFFCWFKLFCYTLRLIVNTRGHRRLKLRYSCTIWSSLCTLANECIPSQLPNTVCHKQLILIMRYAIVHIPPPFVNSLEDLYASDKTIKFDSASGSVEFVKASPKGSLMNRVTKIR